MLVRPDAATIIERVLYQLDPAAPVGTLSKARIKIRPSGDGRHIVFEIDGGHGWYAELMTLDDAPVPQIEPDHLKIWSGKMLVFSASYFEMKEISVDTHRGLSP